MNKNTKIKPSALKDFLKDFLKASLKDFLIFLPVLIAAVAVSNIDWAAAASYIPVPETICGEGGFPCPEGTGIEAAKSLTGKIIDNVRYIVGAVAVLVIVIAGIKLIVSGGNEEVYTKQSEALIFGILGLFFVGLAGEIAQIFEVDRGGFLKDPNVMMQKSRLFTRAVTIVITFIKYIIGSMAVFGIVKAALDMILQGGNEEEVNKNKKSILYGVLGLVIILISNPVINKVFFKIDTGRYPGVEPVRPAVDTQALVAEIAGVTNIVAAIAGPFALLSLIAGGVMYTFSGGEEEKTGKAKKIIMWSLIGLVIIYGAFAIVSTFIARQFTGI